MHRVPQAGARYLAHEAILMGAGTERTDEATKAVQQETLAPKSCPLVQRLSRESLIELANFLHCSVLEVVQRYA